MLVDVTKIPNYKQDPTMLALLTILANGRSSDFEQIKTGVYKINHFNFSNLVKEKLIEYPKLEDNNNEWFDCYGVADNVEQILEKCSMIVNSERKFVISFTTINKQDQNSDGGWRWHKWGKYIGVQSPQAEYIYDEPEIESVIVFHVYEVA